MKRQNNFTKPTWLKQIDDDHAPISYPPHSLPSLVELVRTAQASTFGLFPLFLIMKIEWHHHHCRNHREF